MAWVDKSVLVTGAGGFIGSHLTERLLALGANVTAFVHYNALGQSGWLENCHHARNLKIVAGDIRDIDSVRQAFRGVDTVFHLAALIGIPYSYTTPLSYVRTNIEGTANLLQLAKESGVSRFIQTSTSEVYGTALYAPIDESHALQGQSPYSASKIGADKMAESFYHAFDLPVVVVRPFNTFGPRQSQRAIIPTIINQCLAGGTVRIGNVTPTRDLNYVDDTVTGFIAAASSDRAIGKTINLGSGREISIGALAELIAGLVGVPLRLETDLDRLRPEGSEVERLIAANELAQDILAWKSTISLEDGLARTISWVKQNPSAYSAHEYRL